MINVYRARVPHKGGQLIAEDWPTQKLAEDAVVLATEVLRKGSGYAGKRDLDTVADFITPLLGIDRNRPYGMALLFEEPKQ